MAEENFATQGYFQPQVANIQAAINGSQYPRHHILGLCQEIRDVIWSICCKDALEDLHEELGVKPKIGYEGVELVCRQFYHDTILAWPRFKVTQNRINTFLEQMLSKVVSPNFTALYLELRHDLHPDIYEKIASLLKTLEPLKDLRLYGVGPDAYGCETATGGVACQSFTQPLDTPLLMDGQRFEERLEILNAIVALPNLKTLVVENFNLPATLGHIIKNKPDLVSVHLRADLRTQTHSRHTPLLPFSLLVVKDYFPPIKKLHISANAIINPLALVTAVASSLEELTWEVPEVFYQDEATSWFGQTQLLFGKLRRHATALQKLRVCFENCISDNSFQAAALIGAFKEHIPNLTSLRELELHVGIEGPFIAREFLQALPSSLSRLHLTESYIMYDLAYLDNMLECLYLPTVRTELLRKTGRVVREQDESKRSDYIQIYDHSLEFLSCRYEPRRYTDTREQEMISEQNIRLMKINGRLLDAQRNRHLAGYKNQHVPPRDTVSPDCTGITASIPGSFSGLVPAGKRHWLSS